LSFTLVYDNINTNKKDDGGGDYMKNKELVVELMQKNNGILKSKQAVEMGINNKTLQRLNQAGEIERVASGIYINASQMEDEYLVTQYRCRKGIYSHETALFFHHLCDRTPFKLMLTIPSGYNTRLLKEKDKYKFFYINKDRHDVGKTTLLSPYGNEIVVYDKERTICDCINKKEQLDIDLVLVAVKKYMKEPGADFAKLLKYAEIFNVRGLVRQYMEVLS
jgi:predicted transcriptional regulator of viral defense system